MEELDQLSVAALAAERDASARAWDGSRRMYALTDRRTYDEVAGPLDPLPDQRPDDLVVVPLSPLGPGEITDLLAALTWPDEVRGCVLVAEAVLGEPEREREAHLAVGVLKEGTYTCLLRARDSDELLPCPDAGLLDDLVTALLGTF